MNFFTGDETPFNELFTPEKTVAVVGSSGRLLSKKYGEDIDNHDIVVRFNSAPTNGFEKDVGSRTDARVLNCHTFGGHTPKERFPSFNKSFLEVPRNEIYIVKSDSKFSIEKGLKRTTPQNKVVLLNSQYVYNTAALIKNDPTCGYLMLDLLIKRGFYPSCFGFSFYDDDWNNKHYWENIQPYKQPHSFAKEKNNVLNWKKERLIKFHE